MFAAGSSESFGGCLLAPAQRVQSFRRHRQARDGASRHLLQPSLPQVGRPRLVPHVKIMHYILMVILSVLLLCFATDSWSSFLFFYDQECARTSYRPPSWVSKPHSNAPP